MPTTDGGATWKKAAKGFPGGDLGRIGLAISPADPEILYAIVEAGQRGGFYKSTDRGASWVKQSSHSTSGNYYMEIYCHPTKFQKDKKEWMRLPHHLRSFRYFLFSLGLKPHPVQQIHCLAIHSK